MHAQLLEFYSNSGESDAVIQGGREFLANFPNASQRTSVALLMADAFARKDDTRSEFAIYDSVLQELAAKAQNVPLGSAEGSYNSASSYAQPSSNSSDNNESDAEGEEGQQGETARENARPSQRVSQSFQLGATASPTQQTGARSPEYARVLERYLARLVQIEADSAGAGGAEPRDRAQP